MARGPTPDQVSKAARNMLKREAELRGGTYIKATATRYPEVRIESLGIELSVSLLRASNGEACLLPLARKIGQASWKSGPLNFNQVIALV